MSRSWRGACSCLPRPCVATSRCSRRSTSITSVRAWSRNHSAKVVRRPKIHLLDSGLAAHLVGADPTALARPTSTQSGPLFESFVAGELARQLSWSDTEATLFHYRDRRGVEVDLVLEAPDGRVVGVEVKAAIDVHRLGPLVQLTGRQVGSRGATPKPTENRSHQMTTLRYEPRSAVGGMLYTWSPRLPFSAPRSRGSVP
jgi:hypothetical protein